MCFKTENLVFIWSCPEALYKSCKYRGQFSLKNLKALEQMHLLNLSIKLPLFQQTFSSWKIPSCEPIIDTTNVAGK